jgi:hypothetical protein
MKSDNSLYLMLLVAFLLGFFFKSLCKILPTIEGHKGSHEGHKNYGRPKLALHTDLSIDDIVKHIRWLAKGHPSEHKDDNVDELRRAGKRDDLVKILDELHKVYEKEGKNAITQIVKGISGATPKVNAAGKAVEQAVEKGKGAVEKGKGAVEKGWHAVAQQHLSQICIGKHSTLYYKKHHTCRHRPDENDFDGH